MKFTKSSLLLVCTIALLLVSAFSLMAQEAAPASQPAAGLNIWQSLIPIIVPLLISLLKWGIPKLPSKSIPIVAAVLGLIADACLHFTGLVPGGSTGAIGAALGLAGVGVREVVDQLTKPKTS